MSVERIYHTRRFWGSRVIEKEESNIKSTTIESPWLDVFRQTRKVASRIGKDSVEAARILKKLLKIDTVQNIGCLYLVYLAALNQEPELAVTQSYSSLNLLETRPPVTAPASPASQETPETNINTSIPTKIEEIIPQAEQQSPETIEAKTMIEEYELTDKDYEFLDKINNRKAIFYFDLSGNPKRLHIPKWVYQDAKTVGRKEGIPWYVLVPIGLTETSGWNSKAVSSAGALGLYQIMPFNFPTYQPYEGGDPFDPLFNAWTAVRKIKHMEMRDIPFESWVRKFVAVGGWNQDSPQAWLTFALKEALKNEYLQSTSSSKP